ncbi:MAG: FAD/NAD(P)-binding protein [Burkholderiales bacterium]|nr:FAD/NAD(P)-binding protein [Burkholderiales bacterium]
MLNQSYDFSIIGGGAVGIITLGHIIDYCNINKIFNINIAIFEKINPIGQGLPYNTSNRNLYLNVIPNIPTFKSFSSLSFLDWLLTHHNVNCFKKNVQEVSIYRHHYGEYLQYLLNNILHIANSININIDIIQKEVLDIDIQQNILLVKIFGLERKSIATNFAILTIGHIISPTFSNLANTQHYHTALEFLNVPIQQIKQYKKICVIGSRLTAIDMIVFLNNIGYSKKIYMTSRTCMLPAVRGTITEYTPQIITTIPLENFKTMSANEIIHFILAEINQSLKIPLTQYNLFNNYNSIARLRQEIYLAKTTNRVWQAAITAIAKVAGELWMHISEDVKLELINTYHGVWLTYLGAFPIISAQLLYKLLKKQRLELIRGMILLSSKDNLFTITQNTGEIVTGIDCIIDATGFCNDIRKFESTLIKNLLQKNIITPNKISGINVDYMTCRVQNSNSFYHEKIFALGDISRGVHLTTADLTQLNQHSKRMINFIFKNEYFTKLCTHC